MYKNSGFFKRFIANIIDLSIAISLILLIFYLLTKNINKVALPSASVFYFSSLSAIIVSLLVYLFIPVFFEGKTIGLIILKLKIINSHTKNYSFSSIIKRNLFTSIYFSAVIIFIMLFLAPNSFVVLDKNGQNILSIKDDIYHLIIMRIITVFLSIGFFISMVGYLFVIFKPNRLSIVDWLSETRIVENTLIVSKDKEIILFPENDDRRKFIFKK
ncbi:hypothetical protein MCANPG14_02481 [Mycoplasmopsis canis PG 14]|uniref:RDD family protein n=1 Tax=Mycoplasmopsis canis TaxID=29555 RepID=A0A449AQV9_9BACT|nr:RDD family protein [Mycoplasmopsis canis]AMD81045.1 hypothetical protein AXW82_00485 [Mycoplasmopsis canis PG 14]EIE39896.1 hypothetical protein MCANPG14_02481 [Mycoplasmopsis canis PG 14]VEU68857.1 RDD family protein [Mycoplasmopsis canis]